MKVEKHEGDRYLTYVVFPFLNNVDTPNLSGERIQITLDRHFDNIEITNGIDASQVNGFECSAIGKAWNTASDIVSSLRKGDWQDIAVDETIEAQS